MTLPETLKKPDLKVAENGGCGVNLQVRSGAFVADGGPPGQGVEDVYTWIDIAEDGPYLSAELAGGPMSRTRVFKSGNSQAVRIPAELAYADMNTDLEITRLGEVITIFPARGSLTEAVAALRRMPKPPSVEKREPIEFPERERE